MFLAFRGWDDENERDDVKDVRDDKSLWELTAISYRKGNYAEYIRSKKIQTSSSRLTKMALELNETRFLQTSVSMYVGFEAQTIHSSWFL